jgi:hypothetical protein
VYRLNLGVLTFVTSGGFGVESVWGDGSFVYVTDTNGQLDVLTFDGTAFTQRAYTMADATDVWGDGTYLYVAAGTFGLWAYRFTGTALLPVAQTNGTANRVQGVGSRILVSDRTGGLRSYSFDGTRFTLTGNTGALGNDAKDVWSDGTYAYLGNWIGGFKVFAFTASGGGSEGALHYDAAAAKLAYCNGSTWVSIGK